jgi:hypothetical protein
MLVLKDLKVCKVVKALLEMQAILVHKDPKVYKVILVNKDPKAIKATLVQLVLKVYRVQ